MEPSNAGQGHTMTDAMRDAVRAAIAIAIREAVLVSKDRAEMVASFVLVAVEPHTAAAVAEAVKGERERIADALEGEADVCPCSEDAVVIRGNAELVRANFSHEDADRSRTQEST